MLNLAAYSAQNPLLEVARPKAQIWRLVMGLILIAGVFLLCNRFAHQTLLTLIGPEGYDALFGAQLGANQVSVLLLLFSFAFIILGVLVALKVAHSRGSVQILGDLKLFKQQFWSVLIALLVLQIVVFVLPPWSLGEPLIPNVPLGLWLAVLPFSLLAVLVQVSAEEVLFRGYLQQQIAARFGAPAVWLVVPSLLFGLGHYMPEEAGENAGTITLWAVCFGVLMADLTARAGTLGPAIAVHFMNNVVAIVLVSVPDSLSGLALYHAPFSMNDSTQIREWLPVDFAFMLVSWLAARLALRR